MSRTSYHHGDLANALETAGVELARAGGPDAVVLREAARRAGVSATAAYRHFSGQQGLLERVKRRALGMLADRIREALAAVPRDGDPQDIAVERLLAAGRAYIGFARDEPGCFATAFRRTAAQQSATGSAPDPDAWSAQDLAADDAFGLVGSLVDALVDTGLMAPGDRPGAEFAAWAAVHGLAQLLLDGPLRLLPKETQDTATDRTFRMIADGLAGPRHEV
jgi:AcrR family transcriptional regulator